MTGAAGQHPAVDADLARMRDCLKKLRARGGRKQLGRECGLFASLYELSTAIGEAAAAERCGPATDTACSLCFVLDRMVRPDSETLAAIEGHIELLEEMFGAGRWHEALSRPGQLAGQLAALRAAAGVAGIAEPSHGMGGQPVG